jgi:hypothetical protein
VFSTLFGVMSLKITKCVIVSGASLKRAVTLKHFKEEDGTTYVHLAKTHHGLPALLSLPRVDSGGQRIFTHTDVIETIKKLRDNQFKMAVMSYAPRAVETLGLFSDMGPPKIYRPSKLVLAQLPKTVTVSAPNVGGVDGISFKVLLTKGNMPLYVELNEGVLNYLTLACRHQLDQGCITRKRVAPSRAKRRQPKTQTPDVHHDIDHRSDIDKDVTIDPASSPDKRCSASDDAWVSHQVESPTYV